MKLVEKLEKIGEGDLNIAGGKAANLGAMVRAGLPVPEGFVVFTRAYYEFMEANNLIERTQGLLEGTKRNEKFVLEEISREIKTLLEGGEFPEKLRKEIEGYYRELGSTAVAVRSSATAEDLGDSSFAGQYDSFLNVTSFPDLLNYIKLCWASLWSERAIAYRVKTGVIEDELAPGVIVQDLVDGEKSGILFSANPVNGRRDQMLLNSSWGLGEAIVNGEVSPDQWILEKPEGTISREEIQEKDLMSIRTDGGIGVVPVHSDKQGQPSLSKEEIAELFDLGKKVEDYFRAPQDIEWTCKRGKFYLVQSRPITSLYPVPPTPEDKKGLRVHINFSLVSQGMQEPLTPIGESALKRMFLYPARMFNKDIQNEEDLWWFAPAGGRMYLDMTDALRNEKRWKDIINNELFSDQEPITARALIQVLERNKEELTGEKSRMFSWILRNIIPLLKILTPMAKKALYGKLSQEKARKKALQEWDEWPGKIEKQWKKAKNMEEKLDIIDLSKYTVEGFGILSYLAPVMQNVEKARKMAGPYLEDASEFDLVVQALPHNITTEMGLELMRIAEKLDNEGRQPSLEDREIQDFLARYGTRSNQEIDLGIPQWKEEPEYILELVQSYIDNQSYSKGLDNFARGEREAEQAIENITGKLEKAGQLKKARKVERLLRDYRRLFGLREQSKFILTRIHSIFRDILKEIGEELVSRGKLDDMMDVFFLRLGEIKEGQNLKALVQKNREEYKKNLALTAPRIILSTGESIFYPEEDGDGAIKGIPVSAGVCEGPVRVLSSPEEGSKLKKGDILVTRGTNPAWTPLFINAGALIMETGGPISHGSVVAREYGVPAVVGIKDATTRFQDGQVVRVNGETGAVEIMKEGVSE